MKPPAHLDVLHILGGTNPAGGIERFVEQLAGRPMPHIAQSVWVHRDFPNRASGTLFVRRGRARRLWRGVARDMLAASLDAPGILAWTREHPRCLLHAHSRAGILAAAMVRARASVPLVIHLHFLANRPWLYRSLIRITGATAVFNSRKTCLTFGADPVTSHIIHPAIDWPDAPPDAPHPQPRFAAAGRFSPEKHLDILIDAFSLIRTDLPTAELHLFGLTGGPPTPPCEARIAARARAAGGVRLHPWRDAWQQQLAGRDVFAHLGQPEAFGTSVLEAFALGARIVALRGTFLDDLHPPCADTGIHRAPQLAAHDVARAMRQALADPADARLLWNLRRAAGAAFTWHSCTGSMLAVYRSAALTRNWEIS